MLHDTREVTEPYVDELDVLVFEVSQEFLGIGEHTSSWHKMFEPGGGAAAWLGWSRTYGAGVAQAYPYCFRRVTEPVSGRDLPEATPVRWLLVAARTNGNPAAFDLHEVEPAGFGRRFGALLIDWALCLVASSLYADPRVVAWPPVLALIVLNTLGIGLFGKTPGMALAGLRCISIIDGGAIGLARAFVRAILLALLIPAIIMDGDRRGLHDRAAGSYVVLKPR
jgi:hypothetical protein